MKPSALEFRRAACAALKQATQHLRPSAAARALGISRQRMHTYLNTRATPPADVLATACSKWNFSVFFRGQRFTAESFRTPAAPEPPPPPQLALYETLRRSQRDLRIKVRRVGPSVQLIITSRQRRKAG